MALLVKLMLYTLHKSLRLKQVVAPKGLGISRPTTVVMPDRVGFAQLFSHGTESVAKAL